MKERLVAHAAALGQELFRHSSPQHLSIVIPKPAVATKIIGNSPSGRFFSKKRRIVVKSSGLEMTHELTYAVHYHEMNALKPSHPKWIGEGLLVPWYNTYTTGYSCDDTGQQALEKVFHKPLVEIETDGIQWVKIRSMSKQADGRPSLGIEFEVVDGALQMERIVPDSTAARAGLRKDDVLEEINGVRLNTPQQLSGMMDGMKVGDPLRLVIRRGKQTQTISTTLLIAPAFSDVE